jgi:hypothetical protein
MTSPDFKSEGFGINALERTIVMWSKRLVLQGYIQVSPVQFRARAGIGYDKLSPERIPLSPGQISATDIGTMVTGGRRE